jgi:hypothetical protein
MSLYNLFKIDDLSYHWKDIPLLQKKPHPKSVFGQPKEDLKFKVIIMVVLGNG